MVDRAHDLGDHTFKWHRNELHVVGRAITLPQVVSHLAHAHFMGRTAQIKEQIMTANAAAHHQVGSHRRVVAPGNQRHHSFHRPQRITAKTLVATMGNVVAVVLNLNTNFKIR